MNNPHQHSTNIVPPKRVYTKQQVYDSDTDSINSNIWSPTHTIVGSISSSAATLTNSNNNSNQLNNNKDQKSLESTTGSSIWLQRHQRRNKLHRFLFSCVGFFVLLALLGTVFLWIGSSFILPQQKYTTEISHVPFASSSSSSNRNSHPSSTTMINHPRKSTS